MPCSVTGSNAPARGTLFVREGKGKKDRVLPIGQRALAWIERREQGRGGERQRRRGRRVELEGGGAHRVPAVGTVSRAMIEP